MEKFTRNSESVDSDIVTDCQAKNVGTESLENPFKTDWYVRSRLSSGNVDQNRVWIMVHRGNGASLHVLKCSSFGGL